MFSCCLPKAVYAGENSLCQLPLLVEGVQRVAVFSDRSIEQSGVLEKPLGLLKKKGIDISLVLDLPSEPTCDQVQTVADEFWQTNAQAVVAIGGGSVMDVAKLCSVLPHPTCTVRMLLDSTEHVCRRVRSIMIPTTFGTGSEATPNSIVAVPEKESKVGIITNVTRRGYSGRRYGRKSSSQRCRLYRHGCALPCNRMLHLPKSHTTK